MCCWMMHCNGMVHPSSLHAHVTRMSPYTCRLSVALLIALNLLRGSPATGP
jgi:hypothetical protein